MGHQARVSRNTRAGEKPVKCSSRVVTEYLTSLKEEPRPYAILKSTTPFMVTHSLPDNITNTMEIKLLWRNDQNQAENHLPQGTLDPSHESHMLPVLVRLALLQQ